MSVPLLQQTTTFHQVCADGSFRSAARSLGVAVSTVSRQLDQLELHLGAKLVDRDGRTVALTELGRIYRDRTAAVIDALRDGEDAVREALAHPAGQLTVAAPVALIQGPVGRAALAFLAAFPDVRLEVLGADSDLLPDGVTVHVVLAVTRTPAPDHVVRRALGAIPMRLCASPAYVAAAGEVPTPEALADRRCVVLGSGPAATRVPFVGPGGEVSVQVGAALFTTSVALARSAALAGLGPTGLPEVACARDLASGRLVELIPGWTLADVPFYAYTASRAVPLQVRVFLDTLDRQLAREGLGRHVGASAR